ncbi:FimV/HubP family polar landmark protein [Psychrobacter arenosus]|uniref:FimV/HubP family polar landmark protein n=1 Tax=Psychrobacter arenosus TaxID=256326 RepID=UPI001918B257|nr:FimV/HubP family polar landmark protein [Psychrobacter arenosus]
MNNLIYIVIGLAIVLILAFVLLRSKNTTPPARKPAAVTPPRPTHDRASPAAPAAAAAPNYQDRLTTAQRFIDQQRYDDAINELKQGLVSHPHNKDLTLKLLNIYALTNRNEPFSDLYQSIQMHGDAATLSAANNIKSLLDEEQASSRPAIIDDSASNGIEEGLDFNFSEVNAVENAPVAVQDSVNTEELLELDAAEPEDEPLSFDDLESQLLADDGQITQPEPKVASTPVTSLAMEEGLDFDFGEAETATDSLSLETAEPAQPVEDSGFNLDDSDFSLAVDEPQSTETQTEATTTPADDNVFSLEEDFDFSDSTNTDSNAASNDTEASVPKDFLELDDLVAEDTSETLNTELADAAAATQTIELDAGDLEFNELSFADIENNELGNNDEFSFAIDETETAPTETTAPVTVDATSTSELNNESFATDSLDIESSDIEGFALEESAPTETLATVTDAEPEVLETTEATQSIDMPVSVSDESQFAADFDYVNELDSVQVTIDLAAQYLELGEYESAKRLLKEVANQGTTEQQAQIESLLAKAA